VSIFSPMTVLSLSAEAQYGVNFPMESERCLGEMGVEASTEEHFLHCSAVLCCDERGFLLCAYPEGGTRGDKQGQRVFKPC
jgi:hypothetical protein